MIICLLYNLEFALFFLNMQIWLYFHKIHLKSSLKLLGQIKQTWLSGPCLVPFIIVSYCPVLFLSYIMINIILHFNFIMINIILHFNFPSFCYDFLKENCFEFPNKHNKHQQGCERLKSMPGTDTKLWLTWSQYLSQDNCIFYC